ncbi:LysR family transcriptional regulator substrate-binding protein [Pollutimonas nitritireducens]|uniref:LysR family transcriptional regulator substrate-binding protein n=1 Tax=Pollutimonas nitritireducens TaxID=2045209 RepID=UPI001E5AE86C|nr:LysR family transcriptional regulator substrate-binding protein [Pollutimonas nitritireducens]
MLSPSFSTRRLLDECFNVAGATPNVIAEMNTIPAMPGLLMPANVGIIAAPSAVAEHNKPLRVIPLEGPTPIRTHGLLFMDRHDQTSASTALIALIRKQTKAKASQHGSRGRIDARHDRRQRMRPALL